PRRYHAHTCIIAREDADSASVRVPELRRRGTTRVMHLRATRQKLRLRDAWTTSHGSARAKETLVVRIDDGDLEGAGEIVPVSYHGQSLETAEAAVARAADWFASRAALAS